MGFPPCGKQSFVLRLREAFVDKEEGAAVVFGADEASGGLEDAVHAGKGVGVVETGVTMGLVVFADEVALKTDLRKADADDGDTDKAFAGEVDAFAEDSTHDSESDER